MKRNLLAAAVLAVAGLFADVPKVIFDTDMYTDFDDVGALAVLHSLADAGECEILGTVVSTRKAPSAGMVELINGFYGRGNLPVGAPRGIGLGPDVDPGALKNGSYRIYADMVKAHPELKTPTGDQAPDANETYRKLLAAAPDGSVTVVTVGFTTNLRRLLETKADAISPLDGKALVAKKVKAWYAMACKYADGFEYNSGADGASSKIAFAEWPTPVYFLDFNYGVEVKCGVPASNVQDKVNPVRDVFRRALKDYNEVGKGHPAWDEITVLAAVRGWQSHFGVERGRFSIVDDKGRNHWEKKADGNHYVLTVKTPKAEVGKIVDELIARGPMDWIDGTKLPLEGRAFDDVQQYYDRLPACVQTNMNVNAGVRGQQRHTSGMCFRFKSDASKYWMKWNLTSSDLAAPHMPATGKSGIVKPVIEKLQAEGWQDISFLPNTEQMAIDGEETVDGCHSNDLGMARMGEGFAKAVRAAIK